MALRFSLYFIFLSTIAVVTASAGQLAFGTGAVSDDEVVVPVLLSGDAGAGVAALNFTVNYDPTILEPASAEAGASAVPADRQVHANLASPGNYVVVMMGLGPQTVSDGEIARILFRRKDPAAESTALTIANTSLAALDGSEIASAGSDTQVQFTTSKGEEPTDPPPAENPVEPEPAPVEPTPQTPVDEEPETPPTDNGGGFPGSTPQPQPVTPSTPIMPTPSRPAPPLAAPAQRVNREQLVARLNQLSGQARAMQNALTSAEAAESAARQPSGTRPVQPPARAGVAPALEGTAPVVLMPSDSTANGAMAALPPVMPLERPAAAARQVSEIPREHAARPDSQWVWGAFGAALALIVLTFSARKRLLGQ